MRQVRGLGPPHFCHNHHSQKALVQGTHSPPCTAGTEGRKMHPASCLSGCGDFKLKITSNMRNHDLAYKKDFCKENQNGKQRGNAREAESREPAKEKSQSSLQLGGSESTMFQHTKHNAALQNRNTSAMMRFALQKPSSSTHRPNSYLLAMTGPLSPTSSTFFHILRTQGVTGTLTVIFKPCLTLALLKFHVS